jgi:hypothetical protein
MSGQCAECERLEHEVRETINRVVLIGISLLDAFRDKDPSTFTQLDKQLEATVGEKERAIGALRQHVREHERESATHI